MRVPFVLTASALTGLLCMGPTTATDPLGGDDGISSDSVQWILLSSREALEGRVVDGRWVLTNVPLASAPSVSGLAKECHNDVPSVYAPPSYEWSQAGVSENLLWPAVENAASLGACYQTWHSGPVAYLQFRTAGNHYGRLEARGSNAALDPYAGEYSIWCSPVGAGIGMPAGDGWGTLATGTDMECKVTTRGLQPHQWDSWTATVSNFHFREGSSTYALFL